MNRPDNMRRRVHRSIAAVVVLCGLLALTTYALVASLVSVEGHLFETAQVKIELNGGKVIFDAGDMNIEPGYSIRRNFTVENQGTADVYYRLYLENTAGPLLGVLDFALYDGDTLLFAGTADTLTRENPCEGAVPLAAGETRTLTAVVKMREEAGNAYQNGGMTFDMTVDAVQVRNNPDRAFA